MRELNFFIFIANKHFKMPAPLPPMPVGIPLRGGDKKTKVVVECFLDLACPFSKKMVKALAANRGSWPEEVEFLFQNVPQPWHPHSCLMHEAMLVAPRDKAWDFALELSTNSDLTDVTTKDKTRNELYEILATHAEKVGISKEELLSALLIKDESCNKATQLMKWSVKYHRARSIHVTPTVLINGLEAGDVSSGWGKEEWEAKLSTLL